MSRVAHIIGNGDNASMYQPAKGIKITCNLPPFAVRNVYATCLVDFKMMRAIQEGSVTVPGEWVCGFRPKKHMEKYPQMYMKHASQIKEFYVHLPQYVIDSQKGNVGEAYTAWNCGHMATHYSANRLKATEIHMYGFDSMFDFNLRSASDLFLNSDRGNVNNNRLTNNWRNIWPHVLREFPDTQFVLHHKHDQIKFSIPENVDIRTK